MSSATVAASGSSAASNSIGSGGGASLSRLLKEHQSKQLALKEQNEKKRRVVLEHISTVNKAMVDQVNAGVTQVFTNQQTLESEAKLLQQQTSKFTKQTQHWLALFDQLNQSIKELGDVENWSKMIEADVDSIINNVEYAATGTNTSSSSSSNNTTTSAPPPESTSSTSTPASNSSSLAARTTS